MTKNAGAKPGAPEVLPDETLDRAVGGDGSIPTETLSLNFDKITYTAPPAIKKRG